MLVAIELHEDEVPELDVAAAILRTREGAIRVSERTGSGAKVVVNLGAWPAGAGIAHGPKIVMLIHAKDAVTRHANILGPDFFRLVVFAKNRDVKLFRRNGVILGDQLPSPGDGFPLEIIAEGKIPQHFEKSVMARGAADLLEIIMLAARANTFLGSRGARIIALFAAQENILELVHARVREEQRRIVGRDERRRGQHAVAASLKKLQKTGSYLARFHLNCKL